VYVCEQCGSTSDQPGVCTGPADGYAHEPVERTNEPASVSSTAPPFQPSPAAPPHGVETATEPVDPANGTEVVEQQ